MAYKNAAHAARRAEIEAQRAELRRLEAEEEAKRKLKRKSARFPAKWYLDGGVAIGGVKVRGGFFYAGANMAAMVEPRISEPSLLDPTQHGGIAESSNNAKPLPTFPGFQYIDPAQRRGYIEFLASDRSQAKDIGFVFLYLCGFERRLIIDSSKPGELNKDERILITEELLRILNIFGSKSRSLMQYILMLLLYDETIFKIKNKNEIEEIFDCKNNMQKLLYSQENIDASVHLVISRFSKYNIDIPSNVYAMAAIGSLKRSRNFISLNVDDDFLYSDSMTKLLTERISKFDFKSASKNNIRSLNEEKYPIYYPSSLSIRKSGAVILDEIVLGKIDYKIYPQKSLCDIAHACVNDLSYVQKIVETNSMRDLDSCEFDALDAFSGNCDLSVYFNKKNGITTIDYKLIESDYTERYHKDIQTDRNSVMSANSQQAISMACASLGWQAIFPQNIECFPSEYWKLDNNSPIVCFQRGLGHDTRNGKRCCGAVFGNDEKVITLSVPGQWNKTMFLVYVYAWFIKECNQTFTQKDLKSFLSTYLPEFDGNLVQRKNQVSLFLAILSATYLFNLSTRGIKIALQSCEFSDVQNLIFSLVNEKCLNVLPTDVMNALESLYDKAGRDKTQIMHDYHSGDYKQLAETKKLGFFIDDERLAKTIADTSDVHTILNDAIGDDEIIIEDIYAGNNERQHEVETVPDSLENDTNLNADKQDKRVLEYKNELGQLSTELFSDTDEIDMKTFMQFCIDNFECVTKNDVLNLISNVNNSYQDDVLEVDGNIIYYNGV